MRVLIADQLSAIVPGRLQDVGGEVFVEPSLSGEALGDRLNALNPEVLVVRSTKVNAPMIGRASDLALIVRAGAGVNSIALSAASDLGIYVANCPGKNAAAVAELTIGHLINLDRRIADNVAQLRIGTWNKRGFSSARGLAGRTLAVLGVGTIGREVIVRAKALGMHVRGWSRSLDDAAASALGIARAVTPEDAVDGADAVTVHLALTAETRGRIGQSVFARMTTGAYFINTSRGEVVDDASLLGALDEREILAGLDVFNDEPSASEGQFASALAQHPSVYGTHHIGASTLEASDAVGDEVIRIVTSYLRGDPIPNCVNLAPTSEATHRLVVRHADQIGVLAAVLDVLRGAGINVQEMQNILFETGSAACARIAIVSPPTETTLEQVRALDGVYAAAVSAVSGSERV